MKIEPLDPERCCELKSRGFGFPLQQCRYKWKVEREGHRYCGLHDPERAKAAYKARVEASRRARQEEDKADAEDRRIHAAHEPLVQVCCAAKAWIKNQGPPYPNDLMQQIDHALKLARKEQA